MKKGVCKNMNCKKYKACIVGLIVFALVFGTFAYVKQLKQGNEPGDATLVNNCKDIGEQHETWA
jgi:hypothetical protein